MLIIKKRCSLFDTQARTMPSQKDPSLLNLKGRALPVGGVSNNVFRKNVAATLLSQVACNKYLKLNLRRNVK